MFRKIKTRLNSLLAPQRRLAKFNFLLMMFYFQFSFNFLNFSFARSPFSAVEMQPTWKSSNWWFRSVKCILTIVELWTIWFGSWLSFPFFMSVSTCLFNDKVRCSIIQSIGYPNLKFHENRTIRFVENWKFNQHWNSNFT